MTAARRLVLVCNSHIDPVWLWPWEEGLAATLATFRAAADLCDEFDGFVFCHNEALLYQWVEEYEPPLFERIRALVGSGRWHVCGGWYLQPDCNLPSGESFVRQILAGHRFFSKKLGVQPRVAVNLDPFGHTRGLVQILSKAGFTGYLFCRPDPTSLTLPSDDFVWVGYDGSTVLAHRASEHYNSERGQARAKTERWLSANPDKADGLLLWGVGNHGGGPSREDLAALATLMGETRDRHIVHGRPEDYFAALEGRQPELPRLERDLNPWAPGCYTSMSTVKRAHRRLESRLYSTEKMLVSAAIQGLLEYPQTAIESAMQALLFAEFHDILPGSSVSEVETQALQRLAQGLDTIERLRARAFFALLSGQAPAADGEYPVFVHNPHPFPTTGAIVCEFQPPEPNADRAVFLMPDVTAPDGTPVPLQLEKESCNIQMDQRKRIVFRTTLAPSSTTRFACRLRVAPRPAEAGLRPVSGVFSHRGRDCEVDIDGRSGLVTGYRVGGSSYLVAGALRALVMRDSADPWGMKVTAFRDRVGEFSLMSAQDTAALAGTSATELAPVHIIEEGPVRTVIEALFAYGRSTLRLRYMLPRAGTEFGVEVHVHWSETDAMLKLSLPTSIPGMRVRSQVAFGVECHTREAEELLGQQWVACVSPDEARALTVITDATYGFDYAGSELRLSCVRSPAHAGHPVDDVTPIVRQDRVEARTDQGEHVFHFWLNAGTAAERLSAVDREATVHHEAPMALVAFPAGGGRPAIPGVTLSDLVVQMPAMKMAEDGRRLMARLFEPTGIARRTTLAIPSLGVTTEVALSPFEVRTLAVDLVTGEVYRTDLLERRES